MVSRVYTNQTVCPQRLAPRRAGRRRPSTLAVWQPLLLATRLKCMTADLAKQRQYAHGDLHEERPFAYYCARCDQFADAAHFSDPFHEKTLDAKMLQSVEACARKSSLPSSNFTRPDGAPNLFPDALAKAERLARAAHAKRLRLAERGVG